MDTKLMLMQHVHRLLQEPMSMNLWIRSWFDVHEKSRMEIARYGGKGGQVRIK